MKHDYELESQGLRLVQRHVSRVQMWIGRAIDRLLVRMVEHDQSKYYLDEIGLVMGKPAFDKYEYMSQEERAALATVKEALVHHYAHNSHHPEHFTNGVDGMSLLDLLEMCADWKAASETSPNGSFADSIAHNTERFNFSPQLVNILKNTGREMGWIK